MINKIKNLVKKNAFFLNLYELFFARGIVNVHRADYSRRVLLSYSTYHFKNKDYAAHSNYQESWAIADIFHELGFQVDVVNNNRATSFDLTRYDIIFGEGIPMFQAITEAPNAKKIYYGTGSHPAHCTEQSFARMISYYRKKNFLAMGSIRTSDYRWALAASMADAVVCIGNADTVRTFVERGCQNVLSVDPTFHQRADALELGLVKDFEICKKSMLWFGSYGLLHKGLDLAVEAFRQRPDWTLHVCGYTPAEEQFLQSLCLPENVVIHGFVNVYSDSFKQLALDCGYVVLPSCSEGTATAVITAVGNGAMIPVVTKECGFDIDDFGYRIDLSCSSLVSVIDTIDNLSLSVLSEKAQKAQIAVSERYQLKNYKMNLASCIEQSLNGMGL